MVLNDEGNSICFNPQFANALLLISVIPSSSTTSDKLSQLENALEETTEIVPGMFTLVTDEPANAPPPNDFREFDSRTLRSPVVSPNASCPIVSACDKSISPLKLQYRNESSATLIILCRSGKIRAVHL